MSILRARLNLHYRIYGKGDPLVLIHGAFVNSEIWQHQIEPLSKQFKVITIDLRGHGFSDPSPLNEYSVEIFADDIMRLLDDMGIDRCVFGGLSLGAMIVQHIASKVPERVKGLVLVGAPASMRLTALEKTITTIIFPKRLALWMFGQLTTPQFMKLSFFLTWFMRGSKWLGGDQTRQVIRDSISIIERSEIKKIYAAVHTFRKQNLSKGNYPILLLNGQYDSPVLHYHARYIARSIGDRGSFKMIPNSGHACNFDSPIVFNAFVTRWIEEDVKAADLRSISAPPTLHKAG